VIHSKGEPSSHWTSGLLFTFFLVNGWFCWTIALESSSHSYAQFWCVIANVDYYLGNGWCMRFSLDLIYDCEHGIWCGCENFKEKFYVVVL